MKITSFAKWLLVFTVLAVFSLAAFAQVDTNTVPGTPGTGTPAGSNLTQLLMLLIPVAVPLIIAIGKFLIPKAPGWVLPILAPALGALLDYLNTLVTGNPATPLTGVLLGSAGVGLRELIDQVKGRMKDGPAVPAVGGLFLVTLLMTGCAGGPASHALVRTGVATGIGYSTIKYPQTVPYLRIAGTIICSQAGGTNLSPTEVRAAIDNSPLANGAKTAQGVLILNGALGIYTAVWDSYGTGAVNKYPELKLYLQDTCNGINDAVPKLP